ncbi:MAG: M23 family metallopeptidase [Chloroflexi bacterium]|nr:M23 family metallopeptidase [Chloroflexota bacterium]
MLLPVGLFAIPASPTYADQSPYLLPWQAGQYYECIQGNNSVADHRGVEAYAWDFPMPMGTLILAARGGTVTMVKDDSNTAGFNISYASDANYVVINHGNGTQALYLHLMYGGALVHVGETVVRGQPIALSGDTGWTSGPHLHFVVEESSPTEHLTQSLPISFADVNDWGGVPQPGRWYTSQNTVATSIPRLPPLVASHRDTPIQAIATTTEGSRLDYGIPHGHFFKEANGHGGAGITGYIVTNDYHVPFWGDFASLGGVRLLGYPIADRFTMDGFVDQPFQKAVLQWDAATQSFNFLNVLDILHDDGDDAWLQAYDQIPPPLSTAPDAGLNWSQIVRRHLALLDSNPTLQQYFLNTPDWLNRFGLPMSGVVDEGPDWVVRCQRAALQLWKVDEPWAKAGQITVVNGGDLLKARGLLPPSSTGVDYAPVP